MVECGNSPIARTVAELYQQLIQQGGGEERQVRDVGVAQQNLSFPAKLIQQLHEWFELPSRAQGWHELTSLQQLVEYVERERLAVWQSRFADVPAFPSLAIERAGRAMFANVYRQETLQLSSEIKRNTALGGEHGLVSGMAPFLAVFSLLLHRYSDQERLVVVTPASYFFSVYDAASDFRDYLSRAAKQIRSAERRGDISLGQLCRLSGGKEAGDEHRPILFCLRDPKTEASGAVIDSVQAKLCLELAWEHGDWVATITYDASLYDAVAIRRMLVHYQTMLDAALGQPDQPLGALPLLSKAERQQLLVDWNQTSAAYPREKRIHQLVEEQAEQTPQQIAVVSEEEQLSYRELNEKANQLARHLLRLGAGDGQPVGVCLSRSTGAIVAMLAVLKANGIYVPLDPTYPSERLAYMVENTGITVLITEQRLLSRLPRTESAAILLDQDWPQIAEQPRKNLNLAGTGDDLAYIMYTSGSTGRPKGASCKHRGVVNLLCDLARRLPIAVGDGCSLWTSFSFDVSIFESFSALSAGGTLHIVPDNRIRYDSSRLFAWMSQKQIKSAYVPPFMLEALSEWLKQPGASLSLKRVAVGVEPIWEPTLAEIASRIPGVTIFNIYGPAEATIYCTTYVYDPARSGKRHFPIGRPIANTRIYLLDSCLNPVPVGIPGELYVAGEGLGGGYWNNPGLTAERFLPDPFDPRPHTFMYRTGDRAKYMEDGVIQFLGRIDFQVKVRGHRVEPGEIEAVLAGHPEVRQAVVVPFADRERRTQLAAFLVASSASLDSQSIRRYLEQRLPAYMVPAKISLLKELPLNPNGKLDRKALIAMLTA